MGFDVFGKCPLLVSRRDVSGSDAQRPRGGEGVPFAVGVQIKKDKLQLPLCLQPPWRCSFVFSPLLRRSWRLIFPHGGEDAEHARHCRPALNPPRPFSLPKQPG